MSVNKDIGEIKINIVRIQKDISYIKALVDKHEKTIYGDEGRKGLLRKFDTLALKVTLGASIIAIIATIVAEKIVGRILP